MGVRESKPKYNRSRAERSITPQYNQIPQVPIAPSRVVEQPLYDSQKTFPIQPTQPIIYQPDPNEYLDVIGSDSGNMTVFSWITQLSTCCSSLCTLIVLISFVVWMFLNRSINTLP